VAALPENGERAPLRLLFCCDPGYFQPLAAALASLLASNTGRPLEIHLATGRADPAQEARLAGWLAGRPGVRFHLHRFDWGARRWHTSFHITQAAYLRLFAAEFLDPGIERILYLDADLLVLDDLGPLWETELGAYAAAAVPDPYGLGRREALGLAADAPYVNSGVLLMNLALWRREDLTRRLCGYVESMGDRLLFHDQDALNAVLAGRILPLDYRWNLQARMLRPRGRRATTDPGALARAARAPAILHYTSARKPWLFVMPTPGKALYWRHLQGSPWAGVRPADLRAHKLGEFAFNHLLDLAGVDYTWDRFRRATLAGRGLDRLLAAARTRLGRDHAAPSPRSG
jgi:lipopolysaccharide biosynthesis glycosyltransferase